jgi:hypothetical protein
MVRSANKSIEKEKYENDGFKNILRSGLAVIHPNLKSPFFLCWVIFSKGNVFLHYKFTSF